VVTPVTLGELPLQEGRDGPGTVRLFFSLPAGSYATVLLEALGIGM
jgi:tRNA(Glu) U13 pseudouridine synthase TruD